MGTTTSKRALPMLSLCLLVCTAMIPMAVAAPSKKELESQALAKEKAAREEKIPSQQYLALLNKLIADCPDLGRLYMHRGFWYCRQRVPRWDMVLRDLNKAVKLDPSLNGFCQLHYQRGHAYKSVGDYEKALSCYQQGVATGQGLKEEKIGGLMEVAHACLRLHRNRECLQAIEQVLKLRPEGFGTYLFMADMCHQAKDDAMALAALQHVSDSRANEVDALVKADLLAQAGKPAEGLTLMRRLRARFPGSRAVVDRGKNLADKYGSAEDREFFSLALEKITADPVEKSIMTVQRLCSEGRGDEAMKILATIDAKKLRPDLASYVYSTRGSAHLVARRYEEAAEDLKRLGPPDNLDCSTLIMRAEVLAKLAEGPAALADYNSAIKKASNSKGSFNGRIYRLRAECLEAMGRYREAIADYKMASKDPKLGGTAAIFMARCYERLGDGKSALKAAEEAIAREPGNRLYQMDYGRLLSKAGRYEDAIKQYDHCLTIRRDWPTPYFERAKCLRQVGRLSEAAADEARGRALTAPIADDLGVHVRKTK
ncbi:MAG: tetratricopeptide repeat protein [Candidatus Melainabacteria bacterium]|nr:tetratricopeptide repeat protein [Candidatus Melainabacteria bacterium]